MANFKLSSDMHTNSSTRRCDEWSSEDVKEWLCSNGFRKYSEFLCDMHELDGVALIMLSEEDFRRPPLCETFQVLGDVKRLLAALRKLQIENSDTLKELGIDMTTEEVLHSGSRPIHIHKHYGQKYSCGPVQRSDSTDSPDVSLHPATSRGTCDTCFPPEIWKTLIAAGYMNVVLLVTSFVMVIVHDRVPDMETYPPLPDIFLDNFPTVPWAFILCEYIGMGLMLVLFSTLFIHKHRFIVLRRIFSIGGTVFFLRCISMVITSLSVPGIHLECHEKMYGSLLEQLKRGLEIYAGMGMATQGVRSCGDYMFSGHTCVLTLLNFFITEYTPRRMYSLHTATWVLNLFGIFFILAAHEHYSIDVFIGFYISTRLFLYYHSLANYQAQIMQHDGPRLRVWFPMWYFFERNIRGIVPNEYEWPLPRPLFLVEYFAAAATKPKLG